MCGCRVRVELSTGEKRSRSRIPPPSWNRRPREDFRRRSSPVRRRYASLFTHFQMFFFVCFFYVLFTVTLAKIYFRAKKIFILSTQVVVLFTPAKDLLV